MLMHDLRRCTEQGSENGFRVAEPWLSEDQAVLCNASLSHQLALLSHAQATFFPSDTTLAFGRDQRNQHSSGIEPPISGLGLGVCGRGVLQRPAFQVPRQDQRALAGAVVEEDPGSRHSVALEDLLPRHPLAPLHIFVLGVAPRIIAALRACGPARLHPTAVPRCNPLVVQADDLRLVKGHVFSGEWCQNECAIGNPNMTSGMREERIGNFLPIPADNRSDVHLLFQSLLDSITRRIQDFGFVNQLHSKRGLTHGLGHPTLQVGHEHGAFDLLGAPHSVASQRGHVH
mmetsp:Transcript_73015/g.236262  ORF Transcript_73015/g.236262 Transcript_73015/m.236262 type:complete len:287 (-) Transcript_73015:509-1369(-)